MTMFALLFTASPAARQPTCASSTPFGLDAQYAPDHLNYLCANWTRSTPLPCADAASRWDAKWFNEETKRFIVTAWWPPNPADFVALADAGFNVTAARP